MEAGKWFMESPYVWFRNPSYLRSKVKMHNPELLEAAYAKGNGVVVGEELGSPLRQILGQLEDSPVPCQQ